MRITALKDMERGGYQGTKLWLANLGDGPAPDRKRTVYDRTKLYEFQFGAYGTTHVLVFARSFEDALEEAASFLKDKGWIGHFVDDETMQGYYRDACEEHGVNYEKFWGYSGALTDDDGLSEVLETAEADLTYTESGWLLSYEWWGGEVTDPKILTMVEEAIRFEWDHLDWWS